MRYFLFAYWNNGEGSFILVFDSEEKAQECAKNVHYSGMLADIYSEDEMWKMKRDAEQYNAEDSE
jgi:hypothetical protein